MFQQLVKKVFGGQEDKRFLIVGLDAAGKTTILYKLKLGEIITTIPTIGFNVETVQYKRYNFTMWDVGGCDKIRPLWRHYFQNTQALIYVIDSNDRERLDEVLEELKRFLSEDELKGIPLLVFGNKQDLPTCMKFQELKDRLSKVQDINNRPWLLTPCCATLGDGLYEGLDWLSAAMENPGKFHPLNVPEKTDSNNTNNNSNNNTNNNNNNNNTNNNNVDDKALESMTKKEKQAVLDRQNESVFLKWLTTEDKDTAEEFIAKLEAGDISEWDHRTLLRVVWSYLKTVGRRQAIKSIFENLEKYYDKFPLTLRKNETWIYFWIQMVHYTMETTRNLSGDFVGFLFMSPVLMNAKMPFGFYKKKTILTPEAAKAVVLPDKRPLPSIVPKALIPASIKTLEKSIQQLELDEEDQLSTDEFIEKFEKFELKKWDHRTHIRIGWAYITKYGRKVGSDRIFKGIEQFITNSKISRKTTFHVSMTLFWVQMIDYYLCSSPPGLSFEEFLKKNPQLLDGGLFLQYYKKETLLNNPVARREFVLPDVKPLPSVLPQAKK